MISDSSSRPTQLSNRISNLISSGTYPSRSNNYDIDKNDQGCQCSNSQLSYCRKVFSDRGSLSNPMSSSDLCTKKMNQAETEISLATN